MQELILNLALPIECIHKLWCFIAGKDRKSLNTMYTYDRRMTHYQQVWYEDVNAHTFDHRPTANGQQEVTSLAWLWNIMSKVFYVQIIYLSYYNERVMSIMRNLSVYVYNRGGVWISSR